MMGSFQGRDVQTLGYYESLEACMIVVGALRKLAGDAVRTICAEAVLPR